MTGALDKISELEDGQRHQKAPTPADKPRQAPRFVQPFNNADELREGENAHLEARLTPTDDPTLKVRNRATRTAGLLRLPQSVLPLHVIETSNVAWRLR